MGSLYETFSTDLKSAFNSAFLMSQHFLRRKFSCPFAPFGNFLANQAQNGSNKRKKTLFINLS
jgi:hypothetical protein